MRRRLLIVGLVVAAAIAACWLILRRDPIPYETLEARYGSEASKFLTLENGLIVHMTDEGPPDGPVVILLHGFASSLATWDAWADGLADEYRVLRFDLPGHGLTRVLSDTDLSTEGLVAFVDDVTDELGLQQFTLAGSSMGGHTAWRFALAHPEKLDALILVAAAGLPEADAGEEPPVVFQMIENPFVRPIIKDLDVSSLIRDGLMSSFVDPEFVTNQMVREYADLARAPGHRAALIALATRDRTDAAAFEARLSEISVPVLVLHGREDKIVPPGFANRYGEQIPTSEVIFYDQIGHLPQEEAAAQSLADAKAFLTAALLNDETVVLETAIDDVNMAETEPLD